MVLGQEQERERERERETWLQGQVKVKRHRGWMTGCVKEFSHYHQNNGMPLGFGGMAQFAFQEDHSVVVYNRGSAWTSQSPCVMLQAQKDNGITEDI